MRDEFRCTVSPHTKLEAYIGRRDEATLIELAISDPLAADASVCLAPKDARELAATLADLAHRLEAHLAKNRTKNKAKKKKNKAKKKAKKKA